MWYVCNVKWGAMRDVSAGVMHNVADQYGVGFGIWYAVE